MLKCLKSVARSVAKSLKANLNIRNIKKEKHLAQKN